MCGTGSGGNGKSENTGFLMQVLEPLFPHGWPFQCLPTRIEQTDAQDAAALRAGFERLFLCPEARKARKVVLIWAVDRPYRHTDGSRETSTVVYVEKTNRSIYSRWSRYIDLLTKGSPDPGMCDSENLRALANADNLGFYKRIGGRHGPLQVWWADVSHLNIAATQPLESAREWEQLILCRYCGRYRCLPLKNRRC
jgi:hypothetical protein